MIQGFHSWVHIQKKNKNMTLKRYVHPNVHSSIIYNSQDMEASQMPINRSMDKDVRYIHTYIHTHTRTHIYTWILSSHKKNEIF